LSENKASVIIPYQTLSTLLETWVIWGWVYPHGSWFNHIIRTILSGFFQLFSQFESPGETSKLQKKNLNSTFPKVL